MPDVIDNDALAFARVRARLQSPRAVADDLLAAANDPDRLDGVSPTMARMCAADVLTAGGAGQDAREAITILREAVQGAVPAEIEMAQVALVCAVAESGDPTEAEDLAAGFLRGSPHSGPDFVDLLGLAAMMAVSGFLDQPARWMDEAIGRAARTEGAADRGRGLGLDRHMRQMLEHSKERILEIRRSVAADGVDPDSPAAVREHRGRRPPEADAIGAHPAWPAGLSGRLLWWPEAEYGRLVTQVPEMAAVLGSPWRAHTAQVQAALRAQADQGASGLALVAAEAGRFAQFVGQFDADPVAPATLTAFTAAAAEKSAPVPWPPKRRAPCWCGSGRRYHDCCGG
jgi:SEC-C motif